MNYRHAYHAGNFADVVKHVVLTLVIEYYKRKPAPFRVIDTHAGVGFYDLASEASLKTGEWRDGIGALVSGQAYFSPEVRKCLAPYMDVVAGGVLGEQPVYPGSPIIARALMREADHLVVNELHPDDFSELKQTLRGYACTSVHQLDAWTALKASLPPPERRAIILIDPPFEQPGEFDRMIDALGEARRRFPGGTYILWYPVKDYDAVARFRGGLADFNIKKMMDVRFMVGHRPGQLGLGATGLIVVNPPFTLSDELDAVLPTLIRWMARSSNAHFAIDDLQFS